MKRKQVRVLSAHVEGVGSKKCYFIPTAANVKLTQTQLLAYIDVHTECNWETFDDFVEFETSVYGLDMNEVDWRQSRCNCPFFHKNYICKHIIGLSKQLNIGDMKNCVIPATAKQILLGQKRKRGAPTKAKKALLTQ